MIIILRGTSGSGKTYIVQQVIKALGPHDETVTLGPKAKLGGYKWNAQRVAVVGRYETACGGCDAFSWPGAADEVAELAQQLETQGYAVILEGLIVSAWATARLTSLGPDLHTIHLTTSLEDCLRAVNTRRAERFAAKGQPATPVNPENTTRKHAGLFGCTRRQREFGMAVEELDRDAARSRVFELLKIKEPVPETAFA